MPVSIELETHFSGKLSNRFTAFCVMSAFLLSFPTVAFAQSWSREGAGTFIYQRDVPTRPAQVVGEPAPPAQVILSGPDSPFDAVMHLAPLTDLEAGAINGQPPSGIGLLLPDAPAAGTNPQDVVAYANALATSVATATQGSVAETVNQTTALLNNTTSMIGNVLGSLPTPGGL